MLRSSSDSQIDTGRGATRPGILYLALLTAAIALLQPAMAHGLPPKSSLELTQDFVVTSYLGGRRFLTPQALYVDQNRGEVYVADTGSGRIVVFDSGGQLIAQFNHRPTSDRAAQPVGVAVDNAGRVFVTDSTSHLIYIYDIRGRAVGRIMPSEKDIGALFGRMTLDESDNLYVTVRNKGQVWVYDSDGSLKSKIGGMDDPSQVIEMPSDVTVDGQGRVYVLSSRGKAVHVFSASGAALLRFGDHEVGPHNFSFPTAIDVDEKGRIWVVDSFAHCIKVFTSNGSFVTSIGGYVFPVDFALLHGQNQLFVVEKSAQRLSGYMISEDCTAN